MPTLPVEYAVYAKNGAKIGTLEFIGGRKLRHWQLTVIEGKQEIYRFFFLDSAMSFVNKQQRSVTVQPLLIVA